MTASSDQLLEERLGRAVSAHAHLRRAVEDERNHKIAFMDEARLQQWDWDRIGGVLGVSATAARRYYERNRRKTHGGAKWM